MVPAVHCGQLVAMVTRTTEERIAMEIIESRKLFDLRGLSVTAYMEPDEDETPHGADCYDESDVQAWRAGDWRYVYLRVSVTWQGREIASAGMGGTEHGYMKRGDENTRINALDVVPADYSAGVVHMGSPLAGVIDEAIGEAVTWVNSLTEGDVGEALTAATQWIDPNAHKRTA